VALGRGRGDWARALRIGITEKNVKAKRIGPPEGDRYNVPGYGTVDANLYEMEESRVTRIGEAMDAPKENAQRASLSDSLAAERTYLAWIRTGLALLGLGFVVARFGLFLERLDYIQHVTPSHSYGLSLWFGTGLILAGVAVYLSSAWHYVQLIRALNRGEVLPARPSAQAVLVAIFLALVGLAMAIYLISVRGWQ
jgi:putative membrane protein